MKWVCVKSILSSSVYIIYCAEDTFGASCHILLCAQKPASQMDTNEPKIAKGERSGLKGFLPLYLARSPVQL